MTAYSKRRAGDLNDLGPGGGAAEIGAVEEWLVDGVRVFKIPSTALTDSTGGAASTTTLAAGVGVNTVTIPLSSLATGLSTAAIDLLTEYVPGYRFKVLSFSFVTTVAGTGSSASQVFNLEIETTNVTGGVLTLALADTDTIGKVKAATAVTAANVGTATQKLSIEMAASGTVFTAGAGYFVIKIQNMDTADAFAAILDHIGVG